VLESGPPRLRREQAGHVPLSNLSINHQRVTVPSIPSLGLIAQKNPPNADVTLALRAGTAQVAAGTRIDASTGAITVDAAQGGGTVDVVATDTQTGEETLSPVIFLAIPSGIASTSSSPNAARDSYGGDFTHTFLPPAGANVSAIEEARVNEHFPAASGTILTLSGDLGTFNVTVNDDSSTAGWTLYSGTMEDPDEVTWPPQEVNARPFVANASNPNPAHSLPQELNANQQFMNMTYPAQTWGTTPVASTTHRRAIEERQDRLQAVTSVNGQEVSEDYVGPAVYRRARAAPASVQVSPALDEMSRNLVTVAVDVDGGSPTPTPSYSIPGQELDCTIDSEGMLAVGTTPGTVTVQAGDSINYDEVTVTITAAPAADAGTGTDAGG